MKNGLVLGLVVLTLSANAQAAGPYKCSEKTWKDAVSGKSNEVNWPVMWFGGMQIEIRAFCQDGQNIRTPKVGEVFDSCKGYDSMQRQDSACYQIPASIAITGPHTVCVDKRDGSDGCDFVTQVTTLPTKYRVNVIDPTTDDMRTICSVTYEIPACPAAQ